MDRLLQREEKETRYTSRAKRLKNGWSFKEGVKRQAEGGLVLCPMPRNTWLFYVCPYSRPLSFRASQSLSYYPKLHRHPPVCPFAFPLTSLHIKRLVMWSKYLYIRQYYSINPADGNGN